MAKDIYTLAYELKELLEADQRIKDLNKKEEAMKNSEEVKALVEKKEQAVSLYIDSPKGQKLLHQSKLELDNHPLVRDYLDAYIKVRDLYFEINDILFSGLNTRLKERK